MSATHVRLAGRWAAATTALLLSAAVSLPATAAGHPGAVDPADPQNVCGAPGFNGAGLGTAESPYQITDGQQLCQIRNNLAANYQLMNDIDLAGGLFAEWLPIGTSNSPFTGTLAGGDHSVSNLTITKLADTATAQITPQSTSGPQSGLFGTMSAATVSNLHLDNVSITLTNPTTPEVIGVGALAGAVINGSVTGSSSSGTISVLSASEIIGVGGLIGFVRLESPTTTAVLGSWSTAAVSANSLSVSGVGGLIGRGEVDSETDSVLVSHSVATGSVTVAVNTSEGGGYGGLLGFVTNDSADHPVAVIESAAMGPVTVQGFGTAYGIAGGLLGLSTGVNLFGCVASGSVTVATPDAARGVAGGLVGADVQGRIEQSRAAGDVTLTSLEAGAVGLQPDGDAAPLIGIGGLAGILGGANVLNSFATGAVGGSAQAAGLVGGYAKYGKKPDSTVTNSYATGAAPIGLVGGLKVLPKADPTAPVVPATMAVTSSYWDTQTSGAPAATCPDPAACGVGLDTAAMKQQASFTGWSFATVPGPESVWGICGRMGVPGYPGTGYPFLWTFYDTDPCIGLPGAPTLTTVTAGDASIAATWSAPGDDGGTPITGYRATATSSAGTTTCTTAGPLTCNFTGLANGVPYTVSVIATNATGDSPASNALAATPQANVPPPPPPVDNLAFQPNAANVVGGSAGATMNQAGTPVTLSSDSKAQTQTLTGAGWSVTYQTMTTNGRRLLLVNGVLQLVPALIVQVDATGFVPGTQARLYLAPGPVVLGNLTVDAAGKLSAMFLIPASTTPGGYTLQLNGWVNPTAAPGRLRAAAAALISANLGTTANQSTAVTRPVSKASKLQVQSLPKCSKHYHFKVQKLVTTSANNSSDDPVTATYWKKVGKYTTTGKTQSRTINLPRGTYRAVVYPACGQPSTTSNTTTLKK